MLYYKNRCNVDETPIIPCNFAQEPQTDLLLSQDPPYDAAVKNKPDQSLNVWTKHITFHMKNQSCTQGCR